MSARLLPVCLAAALVAAPALAAPCEKKPHLVTATYAVADLLEADAVCRARLVQPLQLPSPVATAPAAPATAARKEPATQDATPAQDRLMDLITSTIAPQSWDARGGSGQIDYYPMGRALVIKQTPDVHEQIADLLAALRRLQNEEVALEVRIIGVAEDFLKQMNADLPAAAAPPGAPAGASQVRFLDDKEAFQFMEAIQADRRSSVQQAPKVTLLNGQLADVDLTDQQAFLTGVDMVSAGGAIAFVPKNETHEIGVKLSARPVVSADQRFVRVELHLQQTELASRVIPLLKVTTQLEKQPLDGTKGEPTEFNQYVQQPCFDSHAVDVTLAIPAGGTALITGWRHLREGRNEFGPPVLSKIPYISRLFKNVGCGREPEQVLIMVTPRVLVAEEQEEKVAAAPPPKAVPAPTGAEESEAVGPEKNPAQPGAKAAMAREKKLARLVKKYHQACADGHLEEAGKLARMALKLDPACFDK
jgi:type II secretory pathway component GspD/PulD (secretin)